MKLQEIVNGFQVLATLKDTPMPIKTSYKITKNLMNLGQETEFYENKMKEIISKYSLKDENGNIISNEDGITIDSQFYEECQKDLTDLSEMEVDIPIYKLTIDELNGNLAPSSLINLFPFIEE